jgi:hypothetical protein
MKRTGIIVFIFIALLFSGCATLPTPTQMREEVANFKLPKLPEDGKALVYIVRPSYLGTAVWFRVFIDDKEEESEMGYTRGGQYIYFNLEPGDHQILSGSENWAQLNLTASSGDIVFIKQEPNMGFFVARNSLIPIQDYEGRYYVKNLTLGNIIKLDKQQN